MEARDYGAQGNSISELTLWIFMMYQAAAIRCNSRYKGKAIFIKIKVEPHSQDIATSMVVHTPIAIIICKRVVIEDKNSI